MIELTLNLVRIVTGLIFLLFIPGFTLSFLLVNQRKILSIERITISIALSLAIVPVVIFYGYRLNLEVNIINIIMEVLFVTILFIILLMIKKFIKIKKVS